MTIHLWLFKLSLPWSLFWCHSTSALIILHVLWNLLSMLFLTVLLHPIFVHVLPIFFCFRLHSHLGFFPIFTVNLLLFRLFTATCSFSSFFCFYRQFSVPCNYTIILSSKLSLLPIFTIPAIPTHCAIQVYKYMFTCLIAFPSTTPTHRSASCSPTHFASASVNFHVHDVFAILAMLSIVPLFISQHWEVVCIQHLRKCFLVRYLFTDQFHHNNEQHGTHSISCLNITFTPYCSDVSSLTSKQLHLVHLFQHYYFFLVQPSSRSIVSLLKNY